MQAWIDASCKPDLPFRGTPPPLARDHDEIRELLALCRQGRLSEVAQWIDRGRPLQIALEAKGPGRKTALGVAIESGQHDLLRMLLGAGCDPSLERRSPLSRALEARRWDLLELLLEAGADPSGVRPEEVFETYDRAIIDRFWELGVQLAGDGAMAFALATQTRNRALYGFVKNHADDPRVQLELDWALGEAIESRADLNRPGFPGGSIP